MIATLRAAAATLRGTFPGASLVPLRGALLLGALFLSGCFFPPPAPPRERRGGVVSRVWTRAEIRASGERPVERTLAEPESPLVELSEPEATTGEHSERIDLPTVLRLAGARNIDVERMRARLDGARAELDGATALFLPDLTIGARYLRHDGRLQETRGDVFDVSRSSLGLGPSAHLRFDPGSAAFERLRARQVVEARTAGEKRTRAEAVIRSASLYLDLLRARALVEVAEEAARHSRAQVELSEGLVALQAELAVDLARARAAFARDEQRRHEAEDLLRSIAVELAVWLRLPPEIRLLPADRAVSPTTLVDPTTPLDAMIESARRVRPDIQEQEALARAAEESLASARWTPWIPAADIYAGWSWYGGGRGGFFGDFDDRVDFGAGLTWTFAGFGFGDRARERRARAELVERRLQATGMAELAVGQVIRASESARSLRSRITAASAGATAAAEALRLVEERASAGDALQIEVLGAIREVADARAELVGAIVAYNKTQHVLYYRVHGQAWQSGDPSD